LHVALLDELLIYERHRDEICKWLNLPFWEAKAGMDRAEAEVAKLKNATPFLMFVPGVLKVKQAQTRLDQYFGYLRIMEAIRLHAHTSSGGLPSSLDETNLPLPVDPVTGKAYEYTVKDGVATLHGMNPNPGVERTNRYYEIKLRK